MAPEFALEGTFSVKSDVFSFGVLLLEILSGQRNGALYLEEHQQSLIQDVHHLKSPSNFNFQAYIEHMGVQKGNS
jgi:hypothetical protein